MGWGAVGLGWGDELLPVHDGCMLGERQRSTLCWVRGSFSRSRSAVAWIDWSLACGGAIWLDELGCTALRKSSSTCATLPASGLISTSLSCEPPYLL